MRIMRASKLLSIGGFLCERSPELVAVVALCIRKAPGSVTALASLEKCTSFLAQVPAAADIAEQNGHPQVAALLRSASESK